MVKVTNDVLAFFENNKEQRIIIYGAGNAGKWIGYYMIRLNIDFYCYLDREITNSNVHLNGKPIFEPNKIKDFRDESIKIIISPKCYKEICADLLWLDSIYEINALCFVPQYKDLFGNGYIYNINRFLGYFRRSLLKDSTIPTFVANDCTAGFLYESLGMLMRSPTINTGFEPNDYIKFCKDIKKYLKLDLTNIHWERRFGYYYRAIESPVGTLGDIKIIFGHENDLEGIQEKWKYMRENINWNRIIFIMQDGHSNISIENLIEFDELKEKHLFVNMRSKYGMQSKNVVCFKGDWFHDRECVLENNFDLIEWMNRD